MILFTEIRIDKQCKELVVSAMIRDTNYTTNVYLDSIEVCNLNGYNTITGIMKSSYVDTLTENEKAHRWIITLDGNIGTPDDLFFIKVFSRGAPSTNAPCGSDDNQILGIAYDECKFYANGIEALDEIGDPCNPSNDFRDYILNYFAFKTSIISGEFEYAIDIWNNMFCSNKCKRNTGCGCQHSTSPAYSNHSCGCH